MDNILSGEGRPTCELNMALYRIFVCLVLIFSYRTFDIRGKFQGGKYFVLANLTANFTKHNKISCSAALCV